MDNKKQPLIAHLCMLCAGTCWGLMAPIGKDAMLNGIDGNGGTGGFTPAEREQLRQSLRDLAQRINHCADNI